MRDTTDYITVLFGLFGGLGLFLYSLSLLSGGMQKAAGNRIKNLLKKFTDTPLKGAFVGCTVTGIIQSSSITTVVVISLINSGIMTLKQSAGIIFGANVGTTVTAQLVAFPIGKFALPIIAIGALVYFMKPKNDSYAGQILLGFGLLFLGMDIMKDGVAPLKESEYFISILADFAKTPLLGILASAIFTGLIQSSSATTAIIIAMAQEDVIGLSAAIPLIMGANIGTCITALLASYGATKSAKRAAILHVLFNIAGVLLFLPFINLFTHVSSLTATDVPRQIANAHTIFNVTSTTVFLFFIPVFIVLTKKIIPGKEIIIDSGVKFLDNNYLRIPSVALDCVEKEAMRMAKISFDMLKDSENVLLDNKKDLIKRVYRHEDVVDNLLQAIGTYSIKLSQSPLTKQDARRLSAINHNITDFERIADHAINLVESAKEIKDENVSFTKKAHEELSIMFDNSILIYQTAIWTVRTRDAKKVKKVKMLENIIDKNEKDFEHNHIVRLKRKICNPAAGIIFTDILHNLERIGDHSMNVVDRVD
ncbi:MAG: Na/Pi cotransporter family protein [Candidatus Nanohalarchaeota archaeon]|nr:MAG: Na/Pi cotransporter family protein [Candidatus Nanohaloarchaeota archaeon]